VLSQQAFRNIPTKAEQFSTVLKQGAFADERFIYGKYEIKTYSLSDFFVETWTNLTTHEIDKIVVLENEEEWSGFLESVKLRTLF